MAYSVQRLRQAYELGWPNITDRSQCPQVLDFKPYPPIVKRQELVDREKNRIPSSLQRTRKVKGWSNVIIAERKGTKKETGDVP